MPTVWIPSLMRDLTGGADKVEVAGSTMRQVIVHLEDAYPGIKERLCDDDLIRPNISVVVDGAVIPRNLSERVNEHSEIHFVPAISGGV
ncbi:MAG: MoaD/ThiS family protein [Candidatus Latescibacteria bacterium]|nr:MoaD/ThiS family protein [Candidatus Latescibacterota bacterium]